MSQRLEFDVDKDGVVFILGGDGDVVSICLEFNPEKNMVELIIAKAIKQLLGDIEHLRKVAGITDREP